MMQSSTKLKTYIVLALLAAAALLLRLGEEAVPFFPNLAGAKPGICNAVTILCIYLFGLRQAWLYLAVRLLLTGFFVSGVFTPAFIIGAAGALLSFFVMYAFKGSGYFSMQGIGIAGAFAHNTGQVLAAALLMGSTAVFDLLPLLWLLSVPFGAFTGFIAHRVLRSINSGRFNMTF